MIADIDIHRCTWVMIRRYRDDAVIQAAMRGDALLEKGDLGGALVWQGNPQCDPPAAGGGSGRG